ncbi:MAG: CubicO group peptidase (beta-lactamase class C family) [Candidatus Azotimanducaceae bacterium]|jgi:CubicO group peptidase (beta-lactamase class C family)
MLKSNSIADNLIALPSQPDAVSWPTRGWESCDLDNEEVARLSDEVFDLSKAQGVTYALVVIKDGKLVVDRYDAGANPFYLQYSWSMAKSVTHALTGILVRQGKLDIYAPAPVPEWQNDERREITLDQLLRMSSGLKFNEDYLDGGASDVIPMLSLEGRHDTGAFAANMPLVHPPGKVWSYSSGTTNIICRILKEVVGGGASGMLKFMNDELFEPIGVRTATPKFDTSGTFIGSSYLLATPQDFARFGLLYLRGGSWDGREILAKEWVDYARTPTYQGNKECYGAQWWMRPDQPEWFYCGGYDGQRILCVPEKDCVIVRLGRTPIDEMPYVVDRINRIAELI